MTTWIRAGTVAVTNGAAGVTGTGTAWVAEGVRAGFVFYGPDSSAYEVLSVQSDTQLTLATGYDSSTQSGAGYQIQPTATNARTVSALLEAFQGDLSGYIDGALQGRFNGGSINLPGVSARTDLDTGLHWSAANVLSLVTGGVARLDLGADKPGGTAVQATTGSFAADRLALVGSAGWGGPGVNIPGADCDDISASGLYIVAAATDSTPAGTGPSGSFVLAAVFNGDTQLQVFYQRDGTAGFIEYRREKRQGVWQPWRIRQPQRGSNSNGEWVRFPDGTQICTRTVDIDALACTVAIGSLFASVTRDYTFPAAFVGGEAEFVTGDVLGSENVSIRSTAVTVRARRSSGTLLTDWQNTSVITSASVTAAAGETTRIVLQAVGRWY